MAKRRQRVTEVSFNRAKVLLSEPYSMSQTAVAKILGFSVAPIYEINKCATWADFRKLKDDQNKKRWYKESGESRRAEQPKEVVPAAVMVAGHVYILSESE